MSTAGGTECEARCDDGLLCGDDSDCASDVCATNGVCASVLTVSGSYVDADIAAAASDAEPDLVASTGTASMADATGYITDQANEPLYFGVVFEFTDGAAATAAAAVLTDDFAGADITLRLGTTTP